MDELNKLIDRYTEGNYLFGKTAKEEMAKDIFALFNGSSQNEQLVCCCDDPNGFKEMDKVTRVEVIDENGRSYVNWKPTNKVELSIQDNGRTLKVFITDSSSE